MEGYVRNKSPLWRHAMKREVGPGEKISLDALYSIYGIKHDIPEGASFVAWLKEVKLKDRDVWEVAYTEDGSGEQLKESVDDINISTSTKQRSSFIKSELTAEDIIDMSVRTLRERLVKITDLKLLKRALSIANQLQGKETLCKLLRNRIKLIDRIGRV